MEVAFKDKKLEQLCTDEAVMRRKRADIAKKLKRRMAALCDAATLADLVSDDPLGKWHELHANREGHWAAWVSKNHRLIVCPHVEDGQAVVTAVSVTVIEEGLDYH